MSLLFSVEAFQKEVVMYKHVTGVNGFTLDIDQMMRRKLIFKTFDLTTSLPSNYLFVRNSNRSVCLTRGDASEHSEVHKPHHGFHPAICNLNTIAKLVHIHN